MGGLGKIALVTVLLALAAIARAESPDVPLARYRDNEKAGAVGSIEGRVFEERRHPNTPDQPLAGTSVVLCPRSPSLRGRLEAIKDHVRDSLANYRGAATAVRRAREAYEQALWEAGAADLVLGATVGADGAFAVPRVPAGEWLLIGWHASFFERPAAKARRPDPYVFLPRRELTGYQAVAIWLQEIDLAPGASERVELTDRNVWLTGVVEETRVAPKAPAPPPGAVGPVRPGTPGAPGTPR